MSSRAPQPTHRLLLVMVTMILGLDTLVYGLVVPFLPTHAASLGLDVSETGLLFSVFALAQAGTLLTSLRLAHRIRPATLLVGGLVVMAISSAVFALCAESVAGLFIARALEGVAAAMSWIGGMALIVACTPEHTRGRATGLVLMGASIGALIGPPLGGVLYDVGGFATPFIFVVGLCIALLVMVRVAGGALSGPTPSAGPRRSMSGLLGLPGVRPTLAVVLLGSAVLGLMEPILPLQLTAVLGSTPLENGLVFGAAVLGYAISAPAAGLLSDRIGRLRTSAIGLLIGAPALVLLSLGEGWAALIAITAALGVGTGFALSPTMSALADAADAGAGAGPTDYTAVSALHSLMYAGGLFIGPSVGGFLAEQLGLVMTTGLLGGLCIVLALYCAGRGGQP